MNGDDGGVSTHGASTALPFPHRDRAAAGLRAQLRYLVPDGETADWATFTITGPTEVLDPRGNIWFEYAAEVTMHPG